LARTALAAVTVTVISFRVDYCGAAGRKNAIRQRSKQTPGYIDRIREMLLASAAHDTDDTLTQVKGIMAEPPKARSTR